MARHHGEQSDPQGKPSDALRYWYAQETTPLPDMPPQGQSDDRTLPGGWWITPVLLASVLAWVMIGWAVFV
jgi:hypothetical protein